VQNPTSSYPLSSDVVRRERAWVRAKILAERLAFVPPFKKKGKEARVALARGMIAVANAQPADKRQLQRRPVEV
jgi:hypothetical protein